jgi:glycosyltransferase involved in cell wall biosynthesis
MPYPEKDGGAIAINSLAHGLLNAGCSVKMLAMNTKKHHVDINSIPVEFRNRTGFEAIDIDTDVKATKALAALVKGESYNISRFYSEDYKNRLTAILKTEKFDIIQLEGLYLSPYINHIREISQGPIILRAHNVEWIIWEKLANEEKNSIKKVYLKQLVKTLKDYEIEAINKVDGITVFTQTDKKKLEEMGCKKPIEVNPFGIDLGRYIPAKTKKNNSLFFIGALDWMPNLQGLEWFLKEVWPAVNKSFPATEFHVAGRNMPDTLKNASHPNVIFHGEIDNAIDFIKKYDVQIIPLFAGSGIRIKIIEGMALKKPIVSTSQGIEGIECKYGVDILVADKAEGFYSAIKKCIENADFKEKLATNARTYVEQSHNINTITEKLLKFYSTLSSTK